MKREAIQTMIVLSIALLSVIVAMDAVINSNSDLLDKVMGYVTVSMAFIINYYFDRSER